MQKLIIFLTIILSYTRIVSAQTGFVSSYEKISNTQGNLPASALPLWAFGIGMALIGDLNNDGLPEFAVGSNDINSIEGRIHILSMNTNGTVSSLTTIAPNVGGFNGVFPYDMRGISGAIAPLGDLNGDGVEDIAVGNGYGGGSSRGEIYIMFLNSNGTVNNYKWIAEGQNFTGNLQTNDGFGETIATIGDLAHDGTTAIAVSMTGADSSYGGMWILFLNDTGAVVNQQRIDRTNGNFTNQLALGTGLGLGLISPGDLNSDGNPDLIVGCADTSITSNGTFRGALYVLFLDSTGIVLQHQKISPGNGGFVGPLQATYSQFGDGLGNIGDIDGDGLPEISVGASQADDGGQNRGVIWIIFMNADGTIHNEVKIGSQLGGFTATIDNNDFFGGATAGIGDLNGDLRNDLVVGADRDDDGTGNGGAVYILHLNGPLVLGSASEGAKPYFHVYPNPATAEQVTITLPLVTSIANYEVYDVSGNLLKTGTSTSSRFEISMAGLASGVYTIRVVHDGHSYYRQLIVTQF
jgi:hypothetical protein